MGIPSHKKKRALMPAVVAGVVGVALVRSLLTLLDDCVRQRGDIIGHCAPYGRHAADRAGADAEHLTGSGVGQIGGD